MTHNSLEYINALIDNPSQVPSPDWVAAMQQQYPYFVLPAILRLQRTTDIDDNEANSLSQRVALRYSSRKSLYTLIGDRATQFASFYPQPQQAPISTESTIDRFLSEYGADDEKEINALSSLIFNPVGDYKFDDDDIPATPQEQQSPQDALIDRFLNSDGEKPSQPAATPPAIPLPPPVPEVLSVEREDPGTLSESLAKIYIKQKKYAKAYQMLLAVAQQRPDQAHIADQLRFLRKILAAQGENV